MDLPISFDRKFRPWRYTVSHSELELRSFDPDSVSDFIRVTFYGVVGMKLKTVYWPLTIASAEPAQVEEIMDLSDLKGDSLSRIRCLALKSGSRDGLVACVNYGIWRHPRNLDPAASGVPDHESVLILRG